MYTQYIARSQVDQSFFSSFIPVDGYIEIVIFCYNVSMAKDLQNQSDRALLEKTYRLAEETNEELHKMRRAQRFRFYINVLYWIIITGAAVGAFYAFQPYVSQVQGVYSSIRSGIEGFGSASEQLKQIQIPKGR